MDIKRVLADGHYYLLNSLVNRIPSWTIRRILYKISGLALGNGARIGIGTIIDCPKRIIIGERTVINGECHLDGRGGLTIGKDCSISIYTKIITQTHVADSDCFESKKASVSIGDNVWIGCGAIILDGTIIPDYCIIGAGCVYKGVAEPKAVYIGNPARILNYRKLDKKYHLSYKAYFK